MNRCSRCKHVSLFWFLDLTSSYKTSVCSEKKVICADGKLLKCPEGSNSSVPVKTGRISHRLTHRCLEHSKSEAGSAVPKHGSALLKQMPVVVCWKHAGSFSCDVQVAKNIRRALWSKEVGRDFLACGPHSDYKLRLWAVAVPGLLLSLPDTLRCLGSLPRCLPAHCSFDHTFPFGTG